MKICFFGLGSIGSRHLRNLRHIEKLDNYNFEIHAFRSSRKKLSSEVEKLIDKEIYKENKLEFYDIIFVTNPTYKHFETIKKNISRTKHMFIEKPIFHTSKVNIDEINFDPNGIYYVAAPLRFNPVIKYLKNNKDLNDVISTRVICSSYLPEWRKNVDYRDIYSSKKEKGGGVSLDLIHEIDYILYLFGKPEKIVNYRKKVSTLEIDCEDLSVYTLIYPNKIIELHLDYFGKVPRRQIEIFSNDEVLIGDLINNQIILLTSNKIMSFPTVDIYIEELRYFLNSVKKQQKTNNEYQYAYTTLRISEAKL